MSLHLLDSHYHKRAYSKPLNQILAASFSVAALVGLAFPQSEWKVFAQPDRLGSVSSSEQPAIIQVAALTQNAIAGKYKALTPDRQGIVTFEREAVRSHLYSLTGSELATFEGEFISFTPSGQELFTYSSGRTRLYTLSGEEQATFDGAPVSYTPGYQQLLVVDDFGGTVRLIGGIFPTRLYDLNGVEQAIFPGRFEAFMPDGKGLIATCLDSGLVSRIYDLEGNRQATLAGQFVAFTPDGQQLITTDYHNQSRLYSIDGSLQQVLKGHFENATPSSLRVGLPDIDRSNGFTPDGKGFVTSSNDASWLYNFEGDIQQTFKGQFWNFTPDGNGLITYTFGQQSWLYDLDGTLHETFEGKLLGFSPDQQSLIVQGRRQAYLYDLEGNQTGVSEGIFSAFLPDSTGIVTNGSDAEGYRSWLYQLDGDEPAVLEGILLGFALDDQKIVTSAEGLYGPYYIYRTDGTLQATSEVWPRLTPDGQRLVVVENDQTHLQDADRSGQTFAGKFQAFVDSGQRLITYSETDDRSYLYSLDRQL